MALKDRIKTSKAQLYLALSLKEKDDLTDNEVDIMYYLAKDSDIQSVLNEPD